MDGNQIDERCFKGKVLLFFRRSDDTYHTHEELFVMHLQPSAMDAKYARTRLISST